MSNDPAQSKLPPLQITCNSSDCDKGLHAFRQTKKMIAADGPGACRSCHEKVLDWNRVHKRDLNDVAHTFESLRKEMIRHWFWTVEIDDRARERAMKRGRIATRSEMEKRLRTAVGKANPWRDGTQTPLHNSGNIVYYAQHATASCCRKCIEYWHGIERGRELTEEEIQYLLNLTMRYIDERLPELTDAGTTVVTPGPMVPQRN